MLRKTTIWLILCAAPLWGLSQGFKENKGQWPTEVLFKAELPEGDFYFSKQGLLVNLISPSQRHELLHQHGEDAPLPEQLDYHAYRMQFDGAANVTVTGEQAYPGSHNYFIGNDESKWASSVRAFDAIYYSNLYTGIDARFHIASGGLLKYDFIVQPGADIDQIKISYDGVSPSISPDGELIIKTSVNTITEAKPYSYQSLNYSGGSELVEISSSYRLHPDGAIGFKCDELLDKEKNLIIDPVLKFSTFSGSEANNFGYTATFDQAGFLYSGSTAFSIGYPTTTGAYQSTFNGGNVDIAISKYDSTGTFLVYSTYIGGSGSELPHSIIVNDQDELLVFGTTGSDDYPTTSTAYDQSFAGGFGFNPPGLGVGFPSGVDIILSKLSYDGTELLASTYMGANGNDGLNQANPTSYNYADEIRGEIELDPQGNVLIATSTNNIGNPNNFPTTTGVISENFVGGNQDALVFKMNTDLDNLIWSTFIGGTEDDAALSITYNSDGDLIVCGGTESTDFPTTAGSLQSNYQGGQTDPWVMVLNNEATEILYSSYWGTAGNDQAYMVELDGQDNIHLFGQTTSGNDYIINAGYSDANSGQFISKLTPELDGVIWSTSFGTGSGIPDISPTAFLVDLCDRIYLSGWGGPTGSTGLTTNGLAVTNDAYQSTTDGGDFYLMAMADDASSLVYASYFGGDQSNEHVDGGTSRFDRKGKVYQSVCAGCQGNSDFPIFPNNAVSSTNGSSGCNNGVFKMDFELPAVIADFIYTPICLPDSAIFTNTSLGGLTFSWDFGDENSSSDFQPSHLYDEPGFYTVTLLVSDPMSCNLVDSISKDIFIFDPQGAALSDTTICEGSTVQLGFDPLPLPGLSYSWTNAGLLDNGNISNPVATVTETTTFTLTIDNEICPSTASQTVFLQSLNLETSNDTLLCDGDSLELFATTFGQASSYVWSSSPDFSDTLSTDSTLSTIPFFGATYYVMAQDECSAESSVSVGLFSDAFAVSDNVYICADDLVDVSLITESDTEPLTITWSPDDIIVSGQGTPDISVMTASSVWMQVELADANNCFWTDSVFIEVSPLSFETIDATAVPNLIPLGGTSQLGATPSGYDYEWEPANSLTDNTLPNPIASPNGTTTYTVSVIDEDLNGLCKRSDTVTVRVFEFACAFPTIFIPNAFSPNEDGHNDVLYVRGEYIAEFELKIYDRWGEIVFETTDIERGWNGRYKGKRLEPAVYVYHLDLLCIDGQRNFEKGNITLIR